MLTNYVFCKISSYRIIFKNINDFTWTIFTLVIAFNKILILPTDVNISLINVKYSNNLITEQQVTTAISKISRV